MDSDPLPFPTEAELLLALGYPYLPVRVRHREPLAWHPLRDGQETARFTYTGADGEPRYQCIRFQLRPEHPSAPAKVFLWRALDASGTWRWGLDGVEMVPYRLERVRAAIASGTPVWVVEGLKDVHTLERFGFTATCNTLGAMQWAAAYAGWLRGADVIMVPDNDRPGMVEAARVMTSLRGVARSTQLLLLPGLARGEDVSDWAERGGDAATLERLAAAAPRDPSPGELAALLNLPPEVDPLATEPEAIRLLLRGAGAADGAASPFPHPAFQRTAAAFARLGVALAPAAPREPGVPAALPTYRAITAAVRNAGDASAALLDDASLLERAAYELGMMGGLLRAAMAGEPPADAAEATGDAAAFRIASSARVVRTRWDWDAFAADHALATPPETGAAYLLHLLADGRLRTSRLSPLPAMLLEICGQPRTRAQAAAAVAGRVEGDPERITALVAGQMGDLAASGLLRPAAPEPAVDTVAEMARLLPADEAPEIGARGMLGVLSRLLGAVRELVDASAEPDPYGIHLLDQTVGALDELLARARVRPLFAAGLDEFWRGGGWVARATALAPVLDALDRATGRDTQPLPPFVMAQ